MASHSSTVITDAPTAASKDARSRRNRYLVLQAARVVCIMIAFLIPGWPKWIVIAAAAILPAVAVLVANQPNQKALLEAEARARDREDAETDRPAVSDGSYQVIHGEVDETETETDPR
ncbi:MAG TPA: DUF3099 domain-containing protein [Candidatus Avipropionibacterium avicola]|uniref:DUF3099 domain-containing protein n=1 Tax=Candidatus Avipropionibacterium avicola TaxID=2840701 RepID=A0A9D1H0A2_9ACTN|nr:DUF3099 domain-containing protein [Candidatus Avipropionibacterium avicola]